MFSHSRKDAVLVYNHFLPNHTNIARTENAEMALLLSDREQGRKLFLTWMII
jgi:hypothetical protein